MVLLVKVGRITESGKKGQPVQEYAVNGNPTVENALLAAGFETKGLTEEDVRVNGQKKKLADTLKNGDVVLLIPKVSGG